jgi:hypothetical protein
VVVVAEEALAIPVCCSLTATETGSLSDREKSAGMAVGQRRNVTREIEDRTVGKFAPSADAKRAVGAARNGATSGSPKALRISRNAARHPPQSQMLVLAGCCRYESERVHAYASVRLHRAVPSH